LINDLQHHSIRQRPSEGGPRGPPDPQPRAAGWWLPGKRQRFWLADPPDIVRQFAKTGVPAPLPGGPADPWTPLARTLRLQASARAFTEKMFTKTSLPCGRSGSKFAGQDGGSKGGTQTIFNGDTNGSDKQAMHCSCSRRCL
jgi:hypothetical protein